MHQLRKFSRHPIGFRYLFLLMGTVLFASALFDEALSAESVRSSGYARSRIVAIPGRKTAAAPVRSESTKTSPESEAQSSADVPTAASDEPGPKVNPADSVSGGIRVEDLTEQIEVYRFSGVDKPDPFIAPILVSTATKPQSLDSEEIPIVSPLQYYDVGRLIVTGVWESEKGLWKAMIETPEHQGIIAKLQDAAGNSGGRITEISQNGVRVREFSLRKDGTQEFKDRMMPMAKADSSISEFKGGTIILAPGAAAPEVIRPQNEVIVDEKPPGKDLIKDALSSEVVRQAKETNTSPIEPRKAVQGLPESSQATTPVLESKGGAL